MRMETDCYKLWQRKSVGREREGRIRERERETEGRRERECVCVRERWLPLVGDLLECCHRGQGCSAESFLQWMGEAPV